jgi:hypothetical protein
MLMTLKKKKRLDEGLRIMLETFRLPGEAQQIERVVETFSGTYFNSIKGILCVKFFYVFLQAKKMMRIGTLQIKTLLLYCHFL